RHEPAVVDGVAVKAATDEVVHSPGSHAVEGRADDGERVLVAAPEQELERRRRRELRGSAGPAERGVAGARPPPGPLPQAPPRPAPGGLAAAGGADAGLPCACCGRAPPGSSPGQKRSPRRSRQASDTAISSWRKLGMPCRGSGGK